MLALALQDAEGAGMSEVDEITYALSRYIPEIRVKGCLIGTTNGELHIEAYEAALITRALEAILVRRLRLAQRVEVIEASVYGGAR